MKVIARLHRLRIETIGQLNQKDRALRHCIRGNRRRILRKHPVAKANDRNQAWQQASFENARMRTGIGISLKEFF